LGHPQGDVFALLDLIEPLHGFIDLELLCLPIRPHERDGSLNLADGLYLPCHFRIIKDNEHLSPTDSHMISRMCKIAEYEKGLDKKRKIYLLLLRLLKKGKSQ